MLSTWDPEPGALLEIGRCSHWLRPHQTRWTADGGFAWPVGYGNGSRSWSGSRGPSTVGGSKEVLEDLIDMPPLSRILRIDYGALIGALLPTVGWMLACLNTYQPGLLEVLGMGPFPTLVGIGVAVLSSVVGLPLLISRVRAIRWLCENGTEAEAEVSMAEFWRDRGRIEVCFDHAGTQVNAGLALHRTPEAEQLKAGDLVTVRYDPKRPTRMVIPELLA